MRKRKKKHFGAWFLLGLFLIFFVFEWVYSNNAIVVSSYHLTEGEYIKPIRIVFLSDLHGKCFGKNNCRLIKKLNEQKPDAIAFVGDIFDRDADEKQIQNMCSLLSDATKIAPVFFSLGNHEYSFISNGHFDLMEDISKTGVIFIDDNYVDIEFGGTQVRIGGYMGYYPHPHMMTKDKQRIRKERQFFEDFEDTDRYKILLNHIPTSWLDWKYIDKREVDLVLSGHYHGGVIRIPIIEQGLYAPYVGKFPPFTKGIYVGEKATCILTTGMSGSYGIPRFFNPLEICVVDIQPTE